MEKTSTLNIRVNPTLKKEAKVILETLGIPVSTAVDMFLHQVVLVGGISFSVTFSPAPENLDLTKKSDEQLHEMLLKGYEDCKEGRTVSAKEAFDKLRKTHS